MHASRNPIGVIAMAITGTGLVLSVVGTFLPWLRSGAVLRDSYQAVGLLGRLAGSLGGVLDTVLAAWPAVGLLAAMLVVLYLIGLRRSAAVSITVFSTMMGLVGGFAAAHATGDSLIGLVSTGPLVTLVGAVLGVTGSIGVLAAPFRPATTIQETTQ